MALSLSAMVSEGLLVLSLPSPMSGNPGFVLRRLCIDCRGMQSRRLLSLLPPRSRFLFIISNPASAYP